MKSNWQVFKPTPASPWDVSRVVHLHQRAGFAANWARVRQDLEEGPETSIARLLNPPENGEFESMSAVIGDAAMASGNAGRLKAWWFYRMLTSPDPLGERLTLMWHNHFATSNLKVQNLVLMREQNDLFRKFARAPFGDLLGTVIKHPAMLVWLDANANRKGHPNENLARELMELFTLGVGHYTETDVKESARALTGWSIARQAFSFQERRHDHGNKTILGKTSGFNGDDLVDHLLVQPWTAKRIAWRICETFFGEDVVSDAAIDELAAGIRDHDLQTGWAVETVLRSDVFFSEDNLRSRITSPAQFIVGPLRALDLIDPPPSTLVIAEWATRMGHDLFYPPNVFGWSGGRSWINTRSVLARSEYAESLVAGELHRSDQHGIAERLLRSMSSDRFDSGVAIDHLSTLLFGRQLTASARSELQTETRNLDDGPAARRIVQRLLASPEGQLC